MLRGFLGLGFLIVTATTWAFAQESSGLVGTWVGKVQGYEVEMKLVLNADGTADYEGVAGTWRAQGNKLRLTQEGETVAYDFRLQGSQLTLSGGDLMAPLVLSRSGGAAPGFGNVAAPPSAQQPEESFEGFEPAVREAPERGEALQPMPVAKPASSRKRALAEAEVIQLLEAGVASRRLIELVEERGISFRMTPALSSKLKAKGATDQLLVALRRAGGGQTASGPSSAKKSTSGGLAALGELAEAQHVGGAPPIRSPAATRRPSASAGGPRYAHDKWGLSFVTPPGWKVVERQGALLLGSDSEAGLMIIRFVRRTSLQTLAEGYQEGMQEEGLQLMPTGQLESFAAGGSQGLAGEMAGMSNDGYRIRARIIGVQSPFGDSAVVLGLTTEEKYPQLKPRVESLAASLSFTQPQAAPVLEFLAGQYFYMSSSSYGSSERYLNLCSDGTFSESSEIYSTGDAGTAAGGSGGRAQWTADGNESQGVISVTYPNGETKEIQYRRSGTDLNVEGRTYARYGDGSCSKRSPVYE